MSELAWFWCERDRTLVLIIRGEEIGRWPERDLIANGWTVPTTRDAYGWDC